MASSFPLSDTDAVKFCLSCRTGFTAAPDHCDECGRPLISRAEAERLEASARAHREPLENDVLLHVFYTPGEAHAASSVLAAAGIPHRLDHSLEVMGLAQAPLTARLFVLEPDLKAAQAALQAAESSGLDQEGPAPASDSPDLVVSAGGQPAGLARKAAPAPEYARERAAIWRERRFRFLRLMLLLGALYALGLGLAYAGAGRGMVAGALFLFFALYGGLWFTSRRAPAPTFALAAVVGTIVLVLTVAGSIFDPENAASPAEVFGLGLFVLSMYWGWQSTQLVEKAQAPAGPPPGP